MRVVLFLGACVVCCGLIVDATGSEGQYEGPAKGGQPALARTIEVYGVVKPFQQTEIYALITGELRNCVYDIGDRVKKDNMLAELYVPELELELAWKDALIQRANAGVDQAHEAAKAKEAAVHKTKAQIDAASAGIQKAESEQERWQAAHARAARLAEKGVIDRATLDEAFRQVKVAELSVLQAKARFGSAQADRLEAAAVYGKAKADVKSAEVGVALAEADRKRTQEMLARKYVRAPFDGVVLRLTADKGIFAGPPTGNQAKPLFVLARTDIVRIEVDVPEDDALAVVEGARATVRFQALKGKEFSGVVARMAGDIDPKTATRRVEIHLRNPDYRMLPGMHANVVLELQAEEPKKKGASADKPHPQKADAVPALMKARLDVAKKAYGEATQALEQVKRVGSGLNFSLGKPEEVYTWSVRLLNAQREISGEKDKRIAALEEHVKRMTHLKACVTKMVPELLPAIETSAAAWYLAEAELWLVKEKAK